MRQGWPQAIRIMKEAWHDPSPWYVGELAAAPSTMGGATFSTLPPVPVAGGHKYLATLEGPVQRILVGGQEFAIDQICAWP